MFTFRTFRTKGWAHKRDRVRVNDSDLKVQTLALVAAIGEDGGLIDFAIHPLAINTETFVAFVRQLAGKLGGGDFSSSSTTLPCTRPGARSCSSRN